MIVDPLQLLAGGIGHVVRQPLALEKVHHVFHFVLPAVGVQYSTGNIAIHYFLEAGAEGIQEGILDGIHYAKLPGGLEGFDQQAAQPFCGDAADELNAGSGAGFSLHHSQPHVVRIHCLLKGIGAASAQQHWDLVPVFQKCTHHCSVYEGCAFCLENFRHLFFIFGRCG